MMIKEKHHLCPKSRFLTGLISADCAAVALDSLPLLLRMEAELVITAEMDYLSGVVGRMYSSQTHGNCPDSTHCF